MDPMANGMERRMQGTRMEIMQYEVTQREDKSTRRMCLRPYKVSRCQIGFFFIWCAVWNAVLHFSADKLRIRRQSKLMLHVQRGLEICIYAVQSCFTFVCPCFCSLSSIESFFFNEVINFIVGKSIESYRGSRMRQVHLYYEIARRKRSTTQEGGARNYGTEEQ